MHFSHRVEEDVGVKELLRGTLGISARLLTRLKWEGSILADKKPVRTIDRVSKGTLVELILNEEGSDIPPSPELVSKVEIASETEDWVVFNKPSEMPIHPSAGHREDTLGNIWAYLYPNLVYRPVYRLDKDTSGLVLIAKTPRAAALLGKSMDKTYYALAEGNMSGSGRIDVPIKRAAQGVILRMAAPDGESAVTRWRVIDYCKGGTLLALKLDTGRTHQIRVHLSYIGHPLLGDAFYGGNMNLGISRHGLHCGKLTFDWEGTRYNIKSPLPEDMSKILEIKD